MTLVSRFLVALLCLWAATTALAEAASMTVYKSPTCGCCTAWAEHVNRAGFATELHNRQDMHSIKQQLGIPNELQSCHTATINGYVFEGHVPAASIARFLAAPPEGAYGLSVPGMPIGSPGMEMGERLDPYAVILLSKNGQHRVFERIAELQP